MHIVVIFHNIGGYHAARLRAAHSACQQSGWKLTAIQVTEQTREHPWGDIKQEISFPLETLLPADKMLNENDRCPDSPVAASYLPQCLAELKPEVLVIPGWGFPVSRAALRWARHHQIPAILMSESKWDDEKRYWWKEQLKSWLYVRKFDAALVGSKRHRDYLLQLGMLSDRIFLGYDVVDNDYFAQQANAARQDPSAARQHQPKIPKKPYFFAATRFIPRKNVSRLIEAFAEYRQHVGSDRAWDLAICGSGSEEPTIRQQICNHQLNEYIHLPGFITYQQIGDWYGLAQAFIHPALQEQWGLVVNEACAAGLPILCSQTVGACELVRNGQNGFTFDPNNQLDMTRALIAMHQLDSASQHNFGQMSQKIVADYDPTSFGTGLLHAVKSALKNS